MSRALVGETAHKMTEDRTQSDSSDPLLLPRYSSCRIVSHKFGQLLDFVRFRLAHAFSLELTSKQSLIVKHAPTHTDSRRNSVTYMRGAG